MGLRDHKDRAVSPESEARQDQRDLRDHKASGDRAVHRDHPDPRDQLVCRASVVNLDCKVNGERWDHKANQVNQDRPDHKDREEKSDKLVMHHVYICIDDADFLMCLLVNLL